MRIKDVRNIVAGYSDETLRQLISELYKCLPKKIIEDKQIDALIENPPDNRSGKNRVTKQKETPDLDEVCWETEEFIKNAREQNYFAPNQIIHKKERSKWRFVVKRLYKSLIVLSQDPEEIQESSRLLSELYKLMCEACKVYLFNTEDPFASVGIDQAEFYNNVVAVMARTGNPEQWIGEALLLTLEPIVTLDHSLMGVLIEMLKSAPLKEIAIGICEQLRKLKTTPAKHRRDLKYYLEERNDALTKLIFRLNMVLGEKEAAIADFKSHYKDSKVEIELYVLLRQLFNYKEKVLWLREYEWGLQQKVQPRKALVETYKCIKETGDFPQYY
ncbi:MAG: hypothetical protein P4L49_15765 [Desulfosporosinus sp.]|nr:hypothetical protein [Desulfosporosinus sp.]